jgi:predicted enzyme related to lactoylglutathione lyase
MADGSVSWIELNVPDIDKATAFYGSVFPWKLAPMEGYAGYVIINDTAGTGVGALQASEDGDPSGRGATVYFLVANLEDALSRVKAGGGTVEQERMEVPGGQWIGTFKDPFGLKVGMVTNNAAS